MLFRSYMEDVHFLGFRPFVEIHPSTILHEVFHVLTSRGISKNISDRIPNIRDLHGDAYLTALRDLELPEGSPYKILRDLYLQYVDERIPYDRRVHLSDNAHFIDEAARDETLWGYYGAKDLHEFIGNLFNNPRHLADVLDMMSESYGPMASSRLVDALIDITQLEDTQVATQELGRQFVRSEEHTSELQSH